MNSLTLRELELRRAELAHRAALRRAEWYQAPVLSVRAKALSLETKDLQERADDYQTILDVLKLASGKET